jgi:hypothetical protein
MGNRIFKRSKGGRKMKARLMLGLIVSLATVMLLATGAMADKMLCISKEELKGEETVGSCLAKGEKFAVMDDKGVVRIMSPQEIELMKQTNPLILEMKAYGMKYRHLAPDIPKLPPLAVPKQAH